jgi:hypothetical protein
MTAAIEAAAELRFAEKIAAANQDFQRREQEIQETADQRFQKTTDEFNARTSGVPTTDSRAGGGNLTALKKWRRRPSDSVEPRT